jgi:hypothetical protein
VLKLRVNLQRARETGKRRVSPLGSPQGDAEGRVAVDLRAIGAGVSLPVLEQVGTRWCLHSGR